MLLLRRNILPRPWARSLATSARPSTFTPLLINGERRAASDGRTFEVYNPADNQVVGTAASASSSDCIAAIDAAATAHPEWESTPVTTRASILLNVASELEKLKSEVIETLNAETATTSAWAEGNLMGALHTLRTAAGMSTELIGRAYPSALAPGGQVIEQKRALGVVFSIAPWNAPIVLSVRAIAIPLLCGNSVVFKGSEYSPASQSIITDAFVRVISSTTSIIHLHLLTRRTPGRSTTRYHQLPLNIRSRRARSLRRDHRSPVRAQDHIYGFRHCRPCPRH
jgi:acyl-CoA reductase-like NAD-dependent aldehyde dehydrogenase